MMEFRVAKKKKTTSFYLQGNRATWRASIVLSEMSQTREEDKFHAVLYLWSLDVQSYTVHAH